MAKRLDRFKVLVVDDDMGICTAMDQIISDEGYSVTIANSAHEALVHLSKNEYPIVLSDIMMPEMDGMELMSAIKSRSPETIVVLMTGYASIDGAITAIKMGANDYITKPIDYDGVLLMLERNFNLYAANKRVEMMQQELYRNQTNSIVGKSASVKRLKHEISKVSSADLSVLVTGESGTGKELVARAIHQMSPRSTQMFVAVNCASIPNDLLESELFGHEQGAFSGAVRRKYGLFEIADKGTVFLDEIGEMSLDLQAKLLRTLESGTFRRLGSVDEISSDFRVLSATNKDLPKAISNKNFRSDLFYRLNQFHLLIPPLRERKSDIPLLVDAFALKKGRGEKYSALMPESMERLQKYHFPGNVRELFNGLERAFLLAGENIPVPEHFPADMRQTSTRSGLGDESQLTLSELESRHIEKVYNATGRSQTKTAEILGITTRTLYTKLKSLKL